jgi:FAD/FMN-containing dehydrogenase
VVTRRSLVIAGGGLLIAAAAAERASALAAGPAGDKRCPPVRPATSTPGRVAAPGEGGLRWRQLGGTLDDASNLDRTNVFGVVEVRDEADVARALAFARASGLKVSAAGARHSMGGHAFYQGALVLDMTGLNRLSLDPDAGLMTVQSGATGHDVQNRLHPRFAVKAMQSTDIFTVGGSISVNAHGMDHRVGSIARTIRWLRVMLPDGSVRRTSPTQEPELFRLVLGGYGLFGVVLEAQIEVADNVLYRSERRLIDYRDLPRVFEAELRPDPAVGLLYAHLSTAPESLLRETVLYVYREVGPPRDDLPPLGEVEQVGLRRLVFNLAKLGGPAMSAKWLAERRLEPLLESCASSDGGACVVSRNEPMHDSVPYLRNSLKGETDILQEYFVPRARFVPFVEAARDLLRRQRASLLNFSVRVVHREEIALNYAPTDAFAFVLYLNQSCDQSGNERMGRLTRDLIDLAAEHGGTFFLPYQLHYTAEQLVRAYPNVADVLRAKRRYDPDLLLTNTFYETYAPSVPQ